jgi:hypothetical protein
MSSASICVRVPERGSAVAAAGYQPAGSWPLIAQAPDRGQRGISSPILGRAGVELESL